MANKYQTFADLLHASYSGLQALGFAFAKGKKRYDRVCRSCNSSKGTKDLLAWYHERGDFPPMRVLVHYLKLVNQYAIENGLLNHSLDELSGMDLPFDFHYLPLSYPQPEDANESLPIRDFQLRRLESEEDTCRIEHGRSNL